MADSRRGDFHIVIPSRFASTRLPGKPLRLLAGKPLLQHVWERAQEARAASVIVAADDVRILEAARSWGAEALMTAQHHRSGTERLAEVAAQLGWHPDTVVVNLQGDEPLVGGELVASVALDLVRHPSAGIATLATDIGSVEELFDANVVKVVLRDDGSAMYFSRAVIPWCRDAFAAGTPAQLPAGVPFLRHIGLYAYRADVLQRLARAPVSACEDAESLEQLRALALGIVIRVGRTSSPPGRGVDTEHDLALVEQLLSRPTGC
jgi:3-deoxy-manno-octulosonate cytidylyltransferase (CMP-KDO synthetase)